VIPQGIPWYKRKKQGDPTSLYEKGCCGGLLLSSVDHSFRHFPGTSTWPQQLRIYPLTLGIYFVVLGQNRG
jgi:hypothetical protein